MYKKEDNIFLKHSDFYLMKVQYKNIWYDSYIDLDDYEKVSNIIVKDLKSGYFGTVTFDRI